MMLIFCNSVHNTLLIFVNICCREGFIKVFKYVLYSLEQIAPTDTTVLILGESGTGKELIARALNHGSKRRDKSLIKMDCAGLPVNLIESELFGHEKGAFTGAVEKRIGRLSLQTGPPFSCTR